MTRSDQALGSAIATASHNTTPPPLPRHPPTTSAPPRAKPVPRPTSPRVVSPPKPVSSSAASPPRTAQVRQTTQPPVTPASTVSVGQPATGKNTKLAWLMIPATLLGLFLIVRLASVQGTDTATRGTSTPSTYPATTTWDPPTRTSTTIVTSTSVATVTQVPRSVTPVPESRSGPIWDGPWLRNYAEGINDCDSGTNYWVVQPGDSSGLFSLKDGCFTPQWKAALDDRCSSYGLGPICAVWDNAGIMSEFEKRGDLLIVGLTEACLENSRQSDYHQGPLHKYCVRDPTS